MNLIGRITVPSETRDGMDYRVTLVGGTAVACTCPHFHYRADTSDFRCKHMKAADAPAPLNASELSRVRALLEVDSLVNAR